MYCWSDTVPDTVNPSLWRQAQLNAIHGLFKVTAKVYQVRGMDLANMTTIEPKKSDKSGSVIAGLTRKPCACSQDTNSGMDPGSSLG